MSDYKTDEEVIWTTIEADRDPARLLEAADWYADQGDEATAYGLTWAGVRGLRPRKSDSYESYPRTTVRPAFYWSESKAPEDEDDDRCHVIPIFVWSSIWDDERDLRRPLGPWYGARYIMKDAYFLLFRSISKFRELFPPTAEDVLRQHRPEETP